MIGSEQAGITEPVVQGSKIEGAGEDIVAWIVGIGSEAELVPYFGPGAGHQLHQAHGAGAAPYGPARHSRQSAAFDLDDAPDPCFGNCEPPRRFPDIGIPAMRSLSLDWSREAEQQRDPGEPQAAHRSFARPRISLLRLTPK